MVKVIAQELVPGIGDKAGSFEGNFGTIHVWQVKRLDCLDIMNILGDKMWTGAHGKMMTEAGRGCGEIIVVFCEEELIKEILQKLLFCGWNVDVIFGSGDCGIFVAVGGGVVGMFECGVTFGMFGCWEDVGLRFV